MAWNNGFIPDRELVRFGRTGTNNDDGDWYWALTAPTLARVRKLISIAKERTGRDLSPGEGFSCYRPFYIQVRAKAKYGLGAATPGWSSHGGFWEGRETMAVDFSNWGYVYNWNRAAFYEDCRKAGLTPGMISKERGYPDEPWHVIDLNPRIMPSFAGDTSAPTGGQKDWFDMADENTLRAIVRQEVAAEIKATRTNEHFIVSYASSTDRNGIVVAGFGYWHKLTAEEWEHFNWLQSNGGLTIFAGLHIFTPINDRSYDILKSVCLGDGVAEGEGVDIAVIKQYIQESGSQKINLDNK